MSQVVKFFIGVAIGMVICYLFILRSKWWINFKKKYIKEENKL